MDAWATGFGAWLFAFAQGLDGAGHLVVRSRTRYLGCSFSWLDRSICSLWAEPTSLWVLARAGCYGLARCESTANLVRPLSYFRDLRPSSASRRTLLGLAGKTKRSRCAVSSAFGFLERTIVVQPGFGATRRSHTGGGVGRAAIRQLGSRANPSCRVWPDLASHYSAQRSLWPRNKRGRSPALSLRRKPGHSWTNSD